MPPFEERDTLRRYPTKNYRMDAETIALLEAIRRCEPRRFLTFDELLAELARFWLARHPTIRGEVERWLAARSRMEESETKSPEE